MPLTPKAQRFLLSATPPSELDSPAFTIFLNKVNLPSMAEAEITIPASTIFFEEIRSKHKLADMVSAWVELATRAPQHVKALEIAGAYILFAASQARGGGRLNTTEIEQAIKTAVAEHPGNKRRMDFPVSYPPRHSVEGSFFRAMTATHEKTPVQEGWVKEFWEKTGDRFKGQTEQGATAAIGRVAHLNSLSEMVKVWLEYNKPGQAPGFRAAGEAAGLFIRFVAEKWNQKGADEYIRSGALDVYVQHVSFNAYGDYLELPKLEALRAEINPHDHAAFVKPALEATTHPAHAVEQDPFPSVGPIEGPELAMDELFPPNPSVPAGQSGAKLTVRGANPSVGGEWTNKVTAPPNKQSIQLHSEALGEEKEKFLGQTQHIPGIVEKDRKKARTIIEGMIKAHESGGSVEAMREEWVKHAARDQAAPYEKRETVAVAMAARWLGRVLTKHIKARVRGESATAFPNASEIQLEARLLGSLRKSPQFTPPEPPQNSTLHIPELEKRMGEALGLTDETKLNTPFDFSQCARLSEVVTEVSDPTKADMLERALGQRALYQVVARTETSPEMRRQAANMIAGSEYQAMTPYIEALSRSASAGQTSATAR